MNAKSPSILPVILSGGTGTSPSARNLQLCDSAAAVPYSIARAFSIHRPQHSIRNYSTGSIPQE